MEVSPGMERLRKTADELIEEARALIAPRFSPHGAYEAMEFGEAMIIDIRPYEQQVRDGLIPGAVLVDTNVFEFRCDPAQPDEYRNPDVVPGNYNQCLIVLCNQGYQSSLKAANLRHLGLHNATDVKGGMEAWIVAGLPVEPYSNQS